jgi:hypothetical protein
VSTERTRSQIGRASVDRGKETERRVAAKARPWFGPEARRSRDNGSTWTPDQGDLAGMADDRLFWSVKGDRSGSKPGVLASWLAEMRAKAGVRIPILVQRRDGTGDALRWWAWLWADHQVELLTDAFDGYTLPRELLATVPVRLEYGHLLLLLEHAGVTPWRPSQVPSDRALLDRLQGQVLDAGLAEVIVSATAASGSV